MDVVLLPVATGTKRPTLTGWNTFNVERMSDLNYLSQLTGNIGVLLGEASGNLCSIDVDSDEGFTAFLTLNPQFQETLQTRGSCGGNIWFRVDGGYPPLTPLKRIDGSDWGEFRSTGGHTIIHGVHPEGMTYQRLVDRPPMTVAFDSVIWPNDLALPWVKSDYDLLVERQGEPVQYGENGKPTLNEPSLAAKFALEHLTLYERGEGSFYQYDEGTGLWVIKKDEEIKHQLSNDLKVVADDLNDTRLLTQRTNQRLLSLCSILKGQIGKEDIFAHKRALIHCQNGMLDLATNPPVFRTFSPDDYSRNISPIAYDPNACCPRFLNELLGGALPEDDISLIQRAGGAMLMGSNSAQRFLVLSGTAGGGKSTLVSIIEMVIGKQNVVELRTEFLGERFEMYAFLGKTLLTGKDVGMKFLHQKGASKIKSLVGGDLLNCEKKGGAHFHIQGNFNVLVTCNSRLRIRLEGDVDAWQRRLLAINYNRPKPEHRVTEFAETLIAEEGAGILNFFIEGALQHLDELHTTGDYRLSNDQIVRIHAIMQESDSIRQFVEADVIESPGDNITVVELAAAYSRYCEGQGWEAFPQNEVYSKLKALLLELRHVSPRNDIVREGTSKRGYHGITVDQGGQ